MLSRKKKFHKKCNFGPNLPPWCPEQVSFEIKQMPQWVVSSEVLTTHKVWGKVLIDHFQLCTILSDIRSQHSRYFNSFKIFLIFPDIHSYNTRSSASNNFYTQSSRLSIQVNSFSRIGTKIWNEMPVSLRKLPKNAFKRKIKQTLFEILASEDCYIDLPEIAQKVKLNLFSS